jgi:Rrf2 family protein
MQLPIKAHYAALAMLALAERQKTLEQIPARVIAREQGIPSQFLGQILQQLRASGLITSTRGSSGGFRIARSPASITIAEVVDAVCSLTSSCTQSAEDSSLSRLLNEVWDEAEQRQRELLERVTLGDLLARLENSSSAMFYI